MNFKKNIRSQRFWLKFPLKLGFIFLLFVFLLTGCVTDNGLLYFEDGKAKLFDLVFFVDNEELSNTRVDFTYAGLKKDVISNSNGVVSLSFSSEEILRFSSIYFEENIFISDYEDRLNNSDFMSRNIIEISIAGVKNNLFLPLSILNNSKNREIMIWIIKDSDKDFFAISYEKDKNVSVRFELKYSELVNSREFVDYVLDIERSFFGIPVIDQVLFLEDYSIIKGIFPGIDTPEVYIDDTSELVIMWDTGEILTSNNKKDGKKVIVRHGFFECSTNINEELENHGVGIREEGKNDEKKISNGVDLLIEHSKSEECKIEKDETNEIELNSGSETFLNESEEEEEQVEPANEECDQAKFDNEELKIKNEKFLDEDTEENRTMEVELDSGSETYWNESEEEREQVESANEECDQAKLDNEELKIKNGKVLDKNTEQNRTIEIELDSCSETHWNDSEEEGEQGKIGIRDTGLGNEEMEEYFGDDSFEVVYLTDKVVEVNEINAVIIIDESYFLVKVYSEKEKFFSIFEVLYDKDVKEKQFLKKLILVLKNEIKELKIKPIGDKYIEISYKANEKKYKKIVKKK